MSLLMIEVDRFERIRKAHGRLASDHALRAVAARIGALSGERDVVARYGDAEFALVAVGADLGDARGLAGRVERAVEGLRLCVTRGRVPVTVSVGVASQDEVPRADLAAFALVELASRRLADGRRTVA